MADYTTLYSGMVRRNADGAVIPPDFANRDYAEFQVWLELGNMPEVEAPAGSLDPVDTTFAGELPWQS